VSLGHLVGIIVSILILATLGELPIMLYQHIRLNSIKLREEEYDDDDPIPFRASQGVAIPPQRRP
jgi:hypothetical protein